MNDIKKKEVTCLCLTKKRRDFIQNALNFTEDFSDGAFMAYMEERGIDVGEIEAFSDSHKCDSGLGASRA